MRRSPLHGVQREAGATFVEWQGALWAGDFGDATAEHLAVRADVGIWDISVLRKWELRGRRAVELLDGLFTNRVRRDEVGRIRYGLFCDEAGTILNDATVYVLSPDRVWVISARDADGEYLAGAAGRAAVTVESLTDALAAVQVQGPRSRALLAGLAQQIATLGYFRFTPTPLLVAGVECWVSRIGFSGELGFELFSDAREVSTLWDALVASGTRPYGFAAVETLRIEAGLLRLDADFTSGRTRPYDVSLDPVIRLDKPSFVGRGALAAAAAAPRRRLVALRIDGDRVPRRDTALVRGRRRVGTVTSACRSPTLGGCIALASVARACAVPGGRLRLASERGSTDAIVARPPLYDPEGRRVRG